MFHEIQEKISELFKSMFSSTKYNVILKSTPSALDDLVNFRNC